jgi:hypothetical protein
MLAHFNLSVLSGGRSAKFTSALLMAAIVITLVSFTALAWRNKTGFATKHGNAAAQPTPLALNSEYVDRASLSPALREPLNMIGDRLERPGKERLIMSGIISRGQGSGSPLTLIQEFPGRLRMEERVGNQLVVSAVDTTKGTSLLKAGASFTLTEDDEDEIESLVFDSVEGFYLSLMSSNFMRPLGSRFRLSEEKNYTGPLFDLYEVRSPQGIGGKTRSYRRIYFFNSDTLLLDRVRTEISISGGRLDDLIEVNLSGWKRIADQVIPTTITQIKNGQPRLTINITSAVITRKAADGMFTKP